MIPAQSAAFVDRHIGARRDEDVKLMLDAVGYASAGALAATAVPDSIKQESPLALAPAMSESDVLTELRRLAGKNQSRVQMIGHECILDLRELTARTGVTAEDVAKRLIDFGFHAPTLAFPVPGTLMVEPTESEDLGELERFIEAMIAIRAEIDQVAEGDFSLADSPLRRAPHTAAALVSSEWDRPYSREQAAFPGRTSRQDKYFAPVGRVDNAGGDRNLVCSCPPAEAFQD